MGRLRVCRQFRLDLRRRINKKTNDIVGNAGEETYPVYVHFHTLWHTDDEGLLRESHSSYSSRDRTENVVREHPIIAGHCSDVSALAAKKIAVRALKAYMDLLDNAE